MYYPRSCQRLLITLLFSLAATAATPIHAATCGDINGDDVGPDIGDLTRLVNYLFIDYVPLENPELANFVDDGVVDIADLTELIGHLFIDFEPLTCYPLAGSLAAVTLFAPQTTTTTYLIDESDSVVHTWQSGYRPGFSAYLLDDLTLLRGAQLGNNFVFLAGGAAGRVERFDWASNLLWEFEYSSATYLSHHDLEPLPNGNVLLIAWEYKTSTEAIAAGRDPGELVAGALWPDMIIEVEPTGSSGGNVVWEWHVWDHLIQDYDNTKDNFGVVADHPEKINLNFVPLQPIADWTHINAVDYNAELDQIILTVHNFSEIWIIDHNTTTAEAAGPAGDLLYRWGNPQAYDRGTSTDQQLFLPHDGRWIEDGSPGAGDILVFNNGQNRPGGSYSTVDQFTPPEDGTGGYVLNTGEAFGPSAPNWTYQSDPPSEFFAQNISGAQRLPNGNTLICEGPDGRFFEVTPDGTIVWEYINPYSGVGPAGNAVFRISRHWIELP